MLSIFYLNRLKQEIHYIMIIQLQSGLDSLYIISLMDRVTTNINIECDKS